MLGVEKYLRVIGKDVEAIKMGQEEVQNGECYIQGPQIGGLRNPQGIDTTCLIISILSAIKLY